MPPITVTHALALDRVPRSISDGLSEITSMAHDILPRLAAPQPQQPSTPSTSSALAPLQPLEHLTGNNDHTLHRRQTETVFIPLVYKDLDSGPAPGAVAGIVIGSVAGFLLAVWLVWTLTASRRTGLIEGDRDESEVYIRHHTHRSRSPRRRKRRSRRSRSHHTARSEHAPAPAPVPEPVHEVREVVREVVRSPPPPARRRERLVVEETRRTERSLPPPMPPPPMSEHRESFVEERVEERRVEGDDVVEVIEEHSQSEVTPEVEPPKRKKSGYRTVDPNAYGGGNYAQRDVGSHDRERRRSSRR